MASLANKELHRATGEPVSVIAHLSLLQGRRRKRTLLPEYEALMAKTPGKDV